MSHDIAETAHTAAENAAMSGNVTRAATYERRYKTALPAAEKAATGGYEAALAAAKAAIRNR